MGNKLYSVQCLIDNPGEQHGIIGFVPVYRDPEKALKASEDGKFEIKTITRIENESHTIERNRRILNNIFNQKLWEKEA